MLGAGHAATLSFEFREDDPVEDEDGEATCAAPRILRVVDEVAERARKVGDRALPLCLVHGEVEGPARGGHESSRGAAWSRTARSSPAASPGSSSKVLAQSPSVASR